VILIQHRVNNINQLKKIDRKYGIEIDVRSHNSKLILHHDPFKNGPNFSDFLKYYNHEILIINIKEEGIESKILSILKKRRIKNYFMLDVTIPQLTKIINKEKKIAFRISKYENIKGAFKFANILKWVWIDTFDGKLPISVKEILILKKNKYKICLVSPELPTRNFSHLKKMKKKIKKYKKLFDAVCTKKPKMWE
tara:strand:+ start:1062 stop:1646 length:585 start_codon:yes stop_codon:yes gene_type:complete